MPTYRPIEDPDDPCVAAFRDIRERDLVGRSGRFVAEGEVVLGVLLAHSRFAVESCLISRRRLLALEPRLSALPPEVPVNVAGQAAIDAIAGFHIHRGVLALGRRGLDLDARALIGGLGPRAIAVVLVGLTNHDNVGGVFRNAAAFGAGAVLLDPGTCDPLYRKAIRVSVGASLIVPFARAASAADLLDILVGAGFEPIALSPSGTEPLGVLRRSGRTALILGTEGAGLPPEILSRARTLRIPMAEGFDSLNVATASGIALHHLTAEPPA